MKSKDISVALSNVVFERVVYSFEVNLMMVYNDVWPDRVSDQEHRQSLALLHMSCLHELYPHDHLALV